MPDSLDSNTRIAALLRELAAAQSSQQKRWGYRRAAAAVAALDVPIESLVAPDGTLRKIPNVGPASSRVILEFLAGGTSPIVEQAIETSPRRRDIVRGRGVQDHFLSRAQVVAAIRDKTLRGPTLAQYRGDLQMHSVFSDGRQTLAEIIEGCLARGYRYAAVTDHSYGLPIARGVSIADLQRQHREIEALNERYRGRFRLFKGIEANILPDGQLDMTADELRLLEVVVAAPHSKLRVTEDQTTRLVAAMATPGVHILGHPRGRKMSARAGIVADWDLVFAAAAQLEVAIEIDGDPSRQDIDHTLARRALAAGCLFALDSDAHSVAELAYVETAIAHARLAGIPPARVINTWSVARLEKWLTGAWQKDSRLRRS